MSEAREGHVALITASTEPRTSPDERALLIELRRQGVSASRLAWDDPHVEWGSWDLLVIRSTWNYFLDLPKFLRWVRQASKLSSLWNPPRTLRWNTAKSYLRDLDRQGVPIVPTRWLRRGSRHGLDELMESFPGRRIVVKPQVSGGARHTFLVDPGSCAPLRARFERYLAEEDLMVQPYLRSVEGVGERALVFLDDRFSHAVRKPPVLTSRSARYAAAKAVASPEQLRLARRTLDACPERTLYARLDMLQDDRDRWCIGEVEITEPYLFLGHRRGAVSDLAAAIARRARDAASD